MKKNLFIYAILLSAAAVSCDPAETQTPDPVFPEPFNVTVEPGSEYTFTISPDRDWTVSIPASEAGNYFWLNEDGRQTYTVGGEAGEYTISVGVAEEQDYESHTVTISMTMGDITEEIGSLTLPSIDYEFSLYAPVVEDGDFVQLFDQEMSYEYSGDEISAESDMMTLVWPSYSQSAEFVYPALAVANGEFTIGNATSSWLNPVYGGGSDTRREVIISLDMESPDVPVEGATGQIEFVNSADETDTYIYNVSLPALNSIIRFQGMTVRPGTDIVFDADGVQTGSMSGSVNGAIGSFSATEGASAFVIEDLGDYLSPACSWLTAVCEPQTDGLFQTVMYTISAQPNEESESRSAYVVILPASLAAGIDKDNPYMIFDDMAENIRPEYQDYVINVTQEGVQSSGEGISFTLSPSAGNDASMEDLSGIISAAVDLIIATGGSSTAEAETYIKSNIADEKLASVIMTDLVDYALPPLTGSGPCPAAYVLTYNQETVIQDVLQSSSSDYTFTIPYIDQEWLLAEQSSVGLTVSMSASDSSAEGNPGRIQVKDMSGSQMLAIIYCIRNF